MAQNIEIPVVHLNGTSVNALIEQYIDVGQAISAAIEALESNGPHSRDYYVRGPEAWKRASDQHTLCVNKLCQVKQEIEAMILGIDSQID